MYTCSASKQYSCRAKWLGKGPSHFYFFFTKKLENEYEKDRSDHLVFKPPYLNIKIEGSCRYESKWIENERQMLPRKFGYFVIFMTLFQKIINITKNIHLINLVTETVLKSTDLTNTNLNNFRRNIRHQQRRDTKNRRADSCAT